MLNVRILSDEEFDSLPYPEAKISLGLADTKKGQAFVRFTANDELNKYLIEHELEHLLGEDRDEVHHGGDGVYYKGFGNVFQGLGQMFQGAGRSVAGAASNIGNAAKGAGQSIMGMFGGQQPGQQPINIDMKGAAGNAGRMGPQTSMPQAGPAMQAFAPMAPKTGPQVGRQSFQNPTTPNRITPPSNPTVSMPQPMAPKPMAGQNPMASFSLPQSSNAPIGTQTMRSATGAPMSSITPSRMPGFTPPPMFTQSGGGQPNIIPTSRPGASPTPAQAGNKPPMGMFDDPAKLAMGAGMEAIGQFGIQTPNMPDINELPSVQQLRNFQSSSASELDPALEQAINNDFQRIDDKEYQAFVARYKSLRPGADIESDSNFKRDLFELQRMQGQRRADALAKYRFELIDKNLQLSQAELAQMQNLANMDIRVIMDQMSLDYADANRFKETFSRIGNTMITQGLGIGQEAPNVE